MVEIVLFGLYTECLKKHSTLSTCCLLICYLDPIDQQPGHTKQSVCRDLFRVTRGGSLGPAIRPSSLLKQEFPTGSVVTGCASCYLSPGFHMSASVRRACGWAGLLDVETRGTDDDPTGHGRTDGVPR
jgi:hypothetical protein